MLIEPGGGNFVWKNTGEAIFPHRRFFQLLSLLASIKMMIIAPLILTIIWQQMLLKRNIMPFVDFELWGIGKVRERNARLSLQVKHCKNCKCCSVSLLIARSQWLSGIQVLNCQYCNHCLKGKVSIRLFEGVLKMYFSLSFSLPFLYRSRCDHNMAHKFSNVRRISFAKIFSSYFKYLLVSLFWSRSTRIFKY